MVQVFAASMIGFHDIVKGTFKAAVQSERNLIHDRLKRIDENIRNIQNIDYKTDQDNIRQWNLFVTNSPENFRNFRKVAEMFGNTIWLLAFL